MHALRVSPWQRHRRVTRTRARDTTALPLAVAWAHRAHTGTALHCRYLPASLSTYHLPMRTAPRRAACAVAGQLDIGTRPAARYHVVWFRSKCMHVALPLLPPAAARPMQWALLTKRVPLPSTPTTEAVQRVLYCALQYASVKQAAPYAHAAPARRPAERPRSSNKCLSGQRQRNGWWTTDPPTALAVAVATSSTPATKTHRYSRTWQKQTPGVPSCDRPLSCGRPLAGLDSARAPDGCGLPPAENPARSPRARCVCVCVGGGWMPP